MGNPNQQYKPSVNKALLLISLLLFFFLKTYSQNREAYIWYFGDSIGIDFNAGSPPAIASSSLFVHAIYPSSIADSNGNLLFYSNGRHIWNKNHGYMQNGENIGENGSHNSMVIPWPGNDHLYYLIGFKENGVNDPPDLVYSVIDMNLDNGLGGVVPGQKRIIIYEKMNRWSLSAVHHANGNDVWLMANERVTTSHGVNHYYAFLITSDSINRSPTISLTEFHPSGNGGFIKLSPNGKKLVVRNGNYSGTPFFNILDFDNETGEVIDDNQVLKYTLSCTSAEFSSNNSKLYIAGDTIFQYDLNAGSPEEILNSECVIDLDWGNGLQLAPDAKIYMTKGQYLSVINKPNELGTACNFEPETIFLNGHSSGGRFPIFLQSFLDDPIFVTQNRCVGDATTFEIDDIEGIDSVFWKFDDFLIAPYDTSTLFNPVYTFSHAGIYNVELTVYFDLIQKIIKQEVIIHPLPTPNLGNDTLFCDTSFSITINANCEGNFFVWNGIPGGQEITVSDTGTYWVRVVSEGGCVNSDTINIGLYPQPQLDETNLVVSHANCGQNNGSITGLQVTGIPPLAYYWINTIGDTIGFNIDIYNLPTGAYSLIVAYGDCSSTIVTYLVHNIGNIQIDSVTTTNDYCNTNSGILIIYADVTNLGILTYSIDGVNFLPNNGIFNNLSQGSYTIMIKDTNNCEGIYNNNPVIIQNIGGPEIITAEVTPENDFSADGSIFLEATVASGDIYYSIYNGNNPQTNNGLFEGLSGGLYYCKIWDDFGCETNIEIVVTRNTTTILEAISGFGSSCVGDTAVSSLKLDQFDDVYYFETRIHYNINVVNCVGYIELLADLEDGFNAVIIPDLGEVHLNWQGNNPLTLPIQTQMLKLVFGGLGEGISPVYWKAGPEESVFFNQNMDTIAAVCYVGDVQIYSRPEIQMQPYFETCAGDSVRITPDVIGGNGDIGYYWLGPDGYSSISNELELIQANINNTGIYSLFVEDTMQCKQNKTIELNIIPSPEIAFAEYDTLWVEPGFILDAGAGAYSYNWNTGETTEVIVIDSIGRYSVLVTSNDGCKSADVIQILWGGSPFYLPNAFTPNGDGLNDTFGPIPRYDYVNRYHMSIYNRWGQRIYETPDINKGWDGTYKGSPCMLGAYVYRIVYEEFGQQPIESKIVEGTVILVR